MPGATGSYKVTPTSGVPGRSPARPTDRIQGSTFTPGLRRVRPDGRTTPSNIPGAWSSVLHNCRYPPQVGQSPEGRPQHAYSILDGHPVFDVPVDVGAIDRRRAGIGLPPLAADVARRLREEQLAAAGTDRAEPWPTPADGPVLSVPGAMAYDVADDATLSGRREWAVTPGDHPDGICLERPARSGVPMSATGTACESERTARSSERSSWIEALLPALSAGAATDCCSWSARSGPTAVSRRARRGRSSASGPPAPGGGRP